MLAESKKYTYQEFLEIIKMLQIVIYSIMRYNKSKMLLQFYREYSLIFLSLD